MAGILRIVEGLVGLLILPMMALGLMASLSGGGMTPAFQEIGSRLIVWSLFVPLVCLVLAEVVHRFVKLPPYATVIAIVIAAVPIAMWVWLVVWLERETGFFMIS